MRTATVRIACRSVPALGSVSASPPRNSPVASFGNHCCFCASVPKRSTAAAMIRCELKMPVIAIQYELIRATIFA